MFTLRKTTSAFAAAAFALALALLISVLAVVAPAKAAEPIDGAPDVTATEIEASKGGKAPDCATLGYGDYEFKLEGRQLNNGTYTSDNGYLEVSLSDVKFTSSEPTSFDWASNIGVDAVLVKASTGENVYLYDLQDTDQGESTGDDELKAFENRGISHISFCYDLELKVDKTADTAFDRTHSWELNKLVNDEKTATLNLFQGDAGKVDYTIDATKTTTDEYAVSGTITVSNPNTLSVRVTDVTDEISGYNGSVDVDCGVTLPYELEAGGTLQCSYEADLPDGTDRTNTATAESGTDVVDDGVGTAPIEFGEPTVHGNDEINVVDDYGTPGDTTDDKSFTPLSNSGQLTYSRTFDCNAVNYNNNNTATYNNKNTATIIEEGDNSDASVTIKCFKLGVTKTAETSLTQAYTWSIDKSADQSNLKLATGQTFPVNYLVTVNATSAERDHKVSGEITVSNPAPMPANLASVTDEVSGGIGANVKCPEQLTIAANESLTCTYEAKLPDKSDRENIATAKLNNNIGGTTAFSSGAVPVSFTNAKVDTVDETITVSDSLQGNLGSVTAGVDPLPKEFRYSRNVGPYSTSGNYTVENVASFVTNDTKSKGSDNHTVKIEVPASGQGCTLTVGYWKNHAGDASGSSGNQADMVTKHLPISLGTSGGKKSVNVTTATQAVSILTKVDSSNGIEKLYAQLLAAKLNIKNGADGSAVAGTIKDADAFLATYNASNWSKLTKTDQQKVIDWAKKLDQYNNGEIGPGHCNE